MIRTRGRRRLTCHHEAGHAVARWWLGHLADEAVVHTVDEVRAGMTIAGRRAREQQAEGAVIGYDLVEPHMQGQERALRTEMNLVEMYAGPFAEARHRRRPVMVCLIEGGAGDLAEVDRLRAEGFAGEDEGRAASLRAVSIASALACSPKWNTAVRTVAATLLNRGRVDGLEIDALCSDAYGAPFAYDRWAEAWPPTDEQIRVGFLPPARQAAA